MAKKHIKSGNKNEAGDDISLCGISVIKQISFVCLDNCMFPNFMLQDKYTCKKCSKIYKKALLQDLQDLQARITKAFEELSQVYREIGLGFIAAGKAFEEYYKIEKE